MTRAQYAVIRFIADSARGEALNVGAVVWDRETYRLRVDEQATRRVVRDHPFLPSDALLYLEPHLRERLDDALEHAEDVDRAISELIRGQKGFPITITEPRSTTVHEGDADGLGGTLDRLVKRLVTPRRRYAAGRNPTSELARLLRPLIESKAVEQGKAFQNTRSGVEHRVSFYGNHGTNVAIDAVSLATNDADVIRLRGQAEAFKVGDIRALNELTYLVYTPVLEQSLLREPQSAARMMIESAGAEVILRADELADRLTRLIERG